MDNKQLVTDPRGAANGALTVAAIILSVIAIGAVVAFSFVITKDKEDSNAISNASTNSTTTSETDKVITDNEARRMALEYITYVESSYDKTIRIIEIVEPGAKYETTPVKGGGPLFKYDIDYEAFTEDLAEYLDTSLTENLLAAQGDDVAFKTGISNCDGKLCYQSYAGGGGKAYKNITSFEKIADNKYKVAYEAAYGFADANSVEINRGDSVEATFEFTPNKTGGFKITSFNY